jgi:pilus assembly protein CpaE
MTAALAIAEPALGAARDAAVWACLDDPEGAEAVRAAALPRAGAPLIAAGGMNAAFDRLERNAPPEVLIVGIASSPDPAGDIRALAERCGRATRIIALGTANDVALYRDLTAAGAADYLVLPLTADALGAALDSAARRIPSAAETPSDETRVLAVTGAVSGAGASTFAVNAAWHLAASCGRRVALVDLDVQFGRSSLSLDLDPSNGMREILENPDRIDSLFIAGALVPARDGLWVLGAEEPLDRPVAVTARAIDRLVEEIAGTAEGIDTVVLDVPRHTAAADPAVLRRADTVAIVTELSLAGIRDTVRMCERLSYALEDDAIALIAGKQVERGKGEIAAPEFERGVGRRIAHALPWDAKSLALAGRDGKALAEIAANAPLARAIGVAAEALTGLHPGSHRKTLKGLIHHAFRRN